MADWGKITRTLFKIKGQKAGSVGVVLRMTPAEATRNIKLLKNPPKTLGELERRIKK